jgi:hypothetical protein
MIPEPKASPAATKVWAIPELFVMPTFQNCKKFPRLAVIVKALAPALNTMPSTNIPAERETPVMLEDANVAVSADPSGGPPAVQLAAVFQSPVAGVVSHVALPAKLLLAVESRSVSMAAAEGRKTPARKRRGL